MQYEIPELSNSGYVLIKSSYEIDIFVSEDSPAITLTQRDGVAKQYRKCNQDQRSKYEQQSRVQSANAAKGQDPEECKQGVRRRELMPGA